MISSQVLRPFPYLASWLRSSGIGLSFPMSHAVSFSECVGHTFFEGEPVLVFATVDASYQDERHEVEVSRKAYVTPKNMKHLAEHREAPWLPPESVVTAGCDGYEASDVARDIFHSWVRQVKESIPH